MLIAWDAVSTLDRMLDDVMGSTFGTVTNPQAFDPSVDVRANENEVVFFCDVPGVKQEDLEVTVENHVTIRIPKHAKAKPRKIQIGNGSSSKQLKE